MNINKQNLLFFLVNKYENYRMNVLTKQLGFNKYLARIIIEFVVKQEPIFDILFNKLNQLFNDNFLLNQLILTNIKG